MSLPGKMLCSMCCEFVDPEGHRWECVAVSPKTRGACYPKERPDAPEEQETAPEPGIEAASGAAEETVATETGNLATTDTIARPK